MQPSMTFLATVSSGPSGTRRVRISLPRIDCLVDNDRYWLPDTLPAARGEDMRSLYRPRPDKVRGRGRSIGR